MSAPVTLAYVLKLAPFFGGIERLVADLARRHDPARVAPRFALLGDGPLAARLPTSAVVARFPAPRLRKVGTNLVLLADLARTLRAWGAQAVLSHGFAGTPWSGAVAAALRLPHLLWVHEILGKEIRDPGLRLALALPAARVLANSRASHLALTAWFGARRQVHTLFPGVDVARFVEAAERGAAMRARLGAGPTQPLVVAPGRLTPSKGQADFVEAARLLATRFPEARFVVAGAPSSAHDETYVRALRARAEPNTIFAGFVEDAPALMAAADVVVCPSAEPESFGLVVLEAMAAGRPVVATNAGGPAEIVRDGRTGLLVPARDPHALADAVGALLADPARRTALGRAGQEVARAEHDVERTIRALEALVLEVTDGR